MMEAEHEIHAHSQRMWGLSKAEQPQTQKRSKGFKFPLSHLFNALLATC